MPGAQRNGATEAALIPGLSAEEADCMRFFEEMIESLDDSEAESTSSDHAEGRSADSTDGRAAPPPRSAPSPPKSRPPDDSPPQSPTLAHGDPPSARLQNQHQGLARLRYRPPTDIDPVTLVTSPMTSSVTPSVTPLEPIYAIPFKTSPKTSPKTSYATPKVTLPEPIYATPFKAPPAFSHVTSPVTSRVTPPVTSRVTPPEPIYATVTPRVHSPVTPSIISDPPPSVTPSLISVVTAAAPTILDNSSINFRTVPVASTSFLTSSETDPVVPQQPPQQPSPPPAQQPTQQPPPQQPPPTPQQQPPQQQPSQQPPLPRQQPPQQQQTQPPHQHTQQPKQQTQQSPPQQPQLPAPSMAASQHSAVAAAAAAPSPLAITEPPPESAAKMPSGGADGAGGGAGGPRRLHVVSPAQRSTPPCLEALSVSERRAKFLRNASLGSGRDEGGPGAPPDRRQQPQGGSKFWLQGRPEQLVHTEARAKLGLHVGGSTESAGSEEEEYGRAPVGPQLSRSQSVGAGMEHMGTQGGDRGRQIGIVEYRQQQQQQLSPASSVVAASSAAPDKGHATISVPPPHPNQPRVQPNPAGAAPPPSAACHAEPGQSSRDADSDAFSPVCSAFVNRVRSRTVNSTHGTAAEAAARVDAKMNTRPSTTQQQQQRPNGAQNATARASASRPPALHAATSLVDIRELAPPAAYAGKREVEFQAGFHAGLKAALELGHLSGNQIGLVTQVANPVVNPAVHPTVHPVVNAAVNPVDKQAPPARQDAPMPQLKPWQRRITIKSGDSYGEQTLPSPATHDADAAKAKAAAVKATTPTADEPRGEAVTRAQKQRITVSPAVVHLNSPLFRAPQVSADESQPYNTGVVAARSSTSLPRSYASHGTPQSPSVTAAAPRATPVGGQFVPVRKPSQNDHTEALKKLGMKGGHR
ncbi:uncharacterized protein LOC144721402 [Lampetra planeri]